MPLSTETHAAEDVAIYAQGPMAHLFHATHEQSYIAYVMAYASCVGMYANEADCAAALEFSTRPRTRTSTTATLETSTQHLPSSTHRESGRTECPTSDSDVVKSTSFDVMAWMSLAVVVFMLRS